MTDYTKLVLALRNNDWSDACPCCDEAMCKDADCIILQAADAIEALQAEVDALKHDIERYVQMNTELLNDRPELEEIGGKWVWKEPKRGEWVEENRRPRSSQFVCSECHRTAYDPQPTRDKAWKKRCRYSYCPNCGAKMDVQE